VEIERARLIKRLAKIKEEQGQIDEAADLMQEVAVSSSCTIIMAHSYIYYNHHSVVFAST
jgi:hypothetical protein